MSDSYGAWRARLAEANDPAFWPIEAIDNELKEGRAQFWCDGESAIVTRPRQYPGGAIDLEVLTIAGTLESVWQNIEPKLEEYAAQIGAVRLHATGRFGWKRSAVKNGWSPYMLVLKKDISL